MSHQEVTVCQRHKKKEANLAHIANNYYVCMNRYCPQSCTILCSICKVQHRDHAFKVLAIDDIAFLVDRLLKMPFKQASTFISESVEVLKKLKLVNEFSCKISHILKQLQQQTLDLINMTQNIIAEYSQCKTSVQQVSQTLFEFETKEAFQQFKNIDIQKLRKIDYNSQKDRFEYGSLQIKEKEDVRRKNLTYVRRKIQEIKEYSMKIIEVILNNDQSEQEEEDIGKKKRVYENLKNQILNMNLGKIENGKTQKNSNAREENSASTKSDQKEAVQPVQKVQTRDILAQTDNKWVEDYEKRIKQLETQLERSNANIKNLQLQAKSFTNQLQAAFQQHKKVQIQMKNKNSVLQREKQNIRKQRETLRVQKQKIEKTLQQKIQMFNHYERRLRDNFQKRTLRYKQREEVIRQLIQLIEHQRVDGRSRENGQKQNRGGKKI